MPSDSAALGARMPRIMAFVDGCENLTLMTEAHALRADLPWAFTAGRGFSYPDGFNSGVANTPRSGEEARAMVQAQAALGDPFHEDVGERCASTRLEDSADDPHGDRRRVDRGRPHSSHAYRRGADGVQPFAGPNELLLCTVRTFRPQCRRAGGRPRTIGIAVALRTDRETRNVTMGWAIHHQLELYVKTGLAPMQTLAAATVAGANWGRPPVRPTSGRSSRQERHFTVLDARSAGRHLEQAPDRQGDAAPRLGGARQAAARSDDHLDMPTARSPLTVRPGAFIDSTAFGRGPTRENRLQTSLDCLGTSPCVRSLAWRPGSGEERTRIMGSFSSRQSTRGRTTREILGTHAEAPPSFLLIQ